MNRVDSIRQLRSLLLTRRAVLLCNLKSDLALLDEDNLYQYEDDFYQYEDEVSLRLTLNERSELDAIDWALQRMQNGDYGLCEHCGRRIPLGRLKALPSTTMCVRCQTDNEYYDSSGYVDQRVLA